MLLLSRFAAVLFLSLLLSRKWFKLRLLLWWLLAPLFSLSLVLLLSSLLGRNVLDLFFLLAVDLAAATLYVNCFFRVWQ